MPVKYDLHMTVAQTEEEVSLSGEVSDEEAKFLEDFVQYAQEVWTTDFVREGEHGALKINWDRESGTQITASLPDWNQVMVFLHKFRPLLLNNEKTNFYRIHNLLAKKLDHPYFRKSLRLQHELFSGKVCQSEFQIRSNEVLINSENVLFDWLNSHEYHRDEDKKQFIESLHHMFPLDGSKVIFLRLLLYKAVAAINVASFILVVLGKKKEITVKMRPPEEKK
jgi:hypothetical protein